MYVEVNFISPLMSGPPLTNTLVYYAASDFKGTSPFCDCNSPDKQCQKRRGNYDALDPKQNTQLGNFHER